MNDVENDFELHKKSTIFVEKKSKFIMWQISHIWSGSQQKNILFRINTWIEKVLNGFIIMKGGIFFRYTFIETNT